MTGIFHVCSVTLPQDLLCGNESIFIIAIMVFDVYPEYHPYRSFRQRVLYTKKESDYQANGGYTFFIPVEEGFKVC